MQVEKKKYIQDTCINSCRGVYASVLVQKNHNSSGFCRRIRGCEINIYGSSDSAAMPLFLTSNSTFQGVSNNAGVEMTQSFLNNVMPLTITCGLCDIAGSNPIGINVAPTSLPEPPVRCLALDVSFTRRA